MSEQSFSPALESVFAAGDAIDEMNAEAGIVVQTDLRGTVAEAPINSTLKAGDRFEVTARLNTQTGQAAFGPITRLAEDESLKFGALPAPAGPVPVRVMPKDLATLLLFARKWAEMDRNDTEILDLVARNIAST